MAISVETNYDEEKNIIFFRDIADLKTEADIDEFFKIYEDIYKNLAKKAYAISNIDELKIHPEIAEYYGVKVTQLISEYILGHARYATDFQARVMLRNAYMRARVPTHIYDSKAEAIAAIEAMKKKEEE